MHLVLIDPDDQDSDIGLEQPLRRRKRLCMKDSGWRRVRRIEEPGLHFVGGLRGLALQVAPGGARTWVLRFSIAGKREDMALGGFPEITLAGAREKAREALAKADQGIDPSLDRQAARSALRASIAAAKTFAECITGYVDAKSAEWKNPKHRQQVTNILWWAGRRLGFCCCHWLDCSRLHGNSDGQGRTHIRMTEIRQFGLMAYRDRTEPGDNGPTASIKAKRCCGDFLLRTASEASTASCRARTGLIILWSLVQVQHALLSCRMNKCY